jgi:hypothetical protein
MSTRSMHPETNSRETGARKYPASASQPDETDTHAGMPTANPFGLTQPEDETNEKTHQSDNVDQKDAKARKAHARPAPM